MSYSSQIASLEAKRKELLEQIGTSTDAENKRKLNNSLEIVKEQIKRLHQLEWEEQTQRLDFSEDR